MGRMTVMRTTSIVLAVCLGCLACGTPAKPNPPPTPTTPQATSDGGLTEDVATRKILHRKDVPEMPGKESIVILATIPPHSTIGRHSHPGQELAYVLSGSVTLVFDGE